MKHDTYIRPFWFKELYFRTKKRAGERGTVFELEQTDLDRLVRLADGRCMVSGIPFEHEKIEGCFRRPFAPSVDRIDSSKGYTVANCRLVCVMANTAMNQWGLQRLLRLAKNIVLHQDELEVIARKKQMSAPVKFVTVRQFLTDEGVDLSPSYIQPTDSRCQKYCKTHEIATILVEVKGRKTPHRKDGICYDIGFPREVISRIIPEIQEMRDRNRAVIERFQKAA